MATGEKTYSTKGKTPAKFVSKPLPPGEYDLKIEADWSQRVAEGEGKVPYLTGSFTAVGSGNGGKDRKVFHRLFLSLKPGSDGVAMPDRGNGVLGLAKGLGTEFSAPITTMNGQDLLAPKSVLQWLKGNEGAVVRANIKQEKGNAEYPEPKTVIGFFVEAEQQEEAEAEAEAEEAATTEDEAGFGEVEAEEEEVAEITPPRKIASAKKR